MMVLHPAQPLFDWDALEDSPSLQTVKDLLAALRHVTTEAMLAELRRNEGLRRLIGLHSEEGVPKPWNISRFEEVLGQEPHRTLLKEVFTVLIQRLGVAV